MFTKKSKFKLFQIVFVAHDSICACFNQKHKILIYKVIKVHYKQYQNYGTRLAHIMFLSCLTCAMIRYNMQIFSYIENSQKWIWKVGIILRRKINKRRGSRDSKKIF